MDHHNLDIACPTFRTFWRPPHDIETSRCLHIQSKSRTMPTPMQTIGYKAGPWAKPDAGTPVTANEKNVHK